MKLSEIVFLLVVSAAAVGLCLHGWLVERQAPMVILPPAGIVTLLVLFSALRAWRTLRSAPGAPDFTLLQQYWDELRGTFRSLLWCLSTLPLILLLGYPLGLGAFAALLARGHGRGWRASLAAGACTCAVTWLVARWLLGVRLALLPEWLV